MNSILFTIIKTERDFSLKKTRKYDKEDHDFPMSHDFSMNCQTFMIQKLILITTIKGLREDK